LVVSRVNAKGKNQRFRDRTSLVQLQIHAGLPFGESTAFGNHGSSESKTDSLLQAQLQLPNRPELTTKAKFTQQDGPCRQDEIAITRHNSCSHAQISRRLLHIKTTRYS
jgi:hypothetical protein